MDGRSESASRKSRSRSLSSDAFSSDDDGGSRGRSSSESPDRSKPNSRSNSRAPSIPTDGGDQKDDQEERYAPSSNAEAEESRSSGVSNGSKISPTKDKKKLDMFSEVDMFGDNFTVDKLHDIQSGTSENPNLTDNWDDAEGYYRVRIGEVLDSRLVFNKTNAIHIYLLLDEEDNFLLGYY